MGKRVLGGLLAAAIVGGAIAGSQSSDAEVLARLGGVVATKVHAALPDRSQLAGPATNFKVGDRLPVEEQVRLRIHSDKAMNGASVEVSRGSIPGEVRLYGVVGTADLQTRAADIAAGTVGVNRVQNDIAVPE
jgi:hypothetical protein